MAPLYVVDAGALFSTWTQRQPESSFATTESIMDEIRNRPSRQRIDALIGLGRLRVGSPGTKSLRIVEEAATRSGDITALSLADVELIAFAIEIAESEDGTVLVSSDLALLNTAIFLGLSVLDPKGRMKEKRQWILLCPACKHSEEGTIAHMECPVCGTVMKRRVKHKRRFH
jgi:rRNA maturation endonuclease Nob1